MNSNYNVTIGNFVQFNAFGIIIKDRSPIGSTSVPDIFNCSSFVYEDVRMFRSGIMRFELIRRTKAPIKISIVCWTRAKSNGPLKINRTLAFKW